MVATGLIIERKSPVVAMVFLSDRGQKIVAPYRGGKNHNLQNSKSVQFLNLQTETVPAQEAQQQPW